MRGKTGRVSTEIHGGFFHVLKIEEQPEIRFRSREGFCLASLGDVDYDTRVHEIAVEMLIDVPQR